MSEEAEFAVVSIHSFGKVQIFENFQGEFWNLVMHNQAILQHPSSNRFELMGPFSLYRAETGLIKRILTPSKAAYVQHRNCQLAH